MSLMSRVGSEERTDWSRKMNNQHSGHSDLSE